MIYDLIDKIYEPTGNTLTDDEGNEYSEMQELDGYHVNMLDVEDMDLIEDYIVQVNSPSRKFAGRDDTVCLKFKDRDEWLSLGIEEIEDED